MATSPKPLRDKPPAPRLQPRPTAASAARAARNATNRNLSLTPAPTKSPNRIPAKTRYPPSLLRSPPLHKLDSKSDIKSNVKAEVNASPPAPQTEPDSFIEISRHPSELIRDTNNSVVPSESAVSQAATDETFEIQKCLEDDSNQETADNDQPRAENNEPRVENNELKIENNETRAENNEATAQNNELRPENNEPSTENIEPRAQSYELKTENDELRAESNEPRAENNEPRAENNEPCEPVVALPPPPSKQATPRSSRPQTPTRNAPSSRPPTPRSRPVTPCKAPSKPTSRPVTPINNRPKTPTNIPVPVPVQKNKTRQTKAKEDFDELKLEFTAKQRQFHRLKKDLDLKQQALLELFDNLRTLSERISQDGKDGSGEIVPIQDLVVFNVGDWTADEIAQLCRDALASTDTENAIKAINTTKLIDECALAEIDSNISKVPDHFVDLCLQAFSSRQELIDWVKELIGRDEGGEPECADRIERYNAQGLELCEALSELKARTDGVMDAVSNISRRACQERSALMAVGEALVREIAQLRQDLEARAVIVNEMREIRAENDTVKLLEDTRRTLDEERANSRAIKDKLASTEANLRQTRVRISKMDRQLREAEASIASLTGTVKSLEDQSRQREVHLEARARKLKESLKTGEMANNHIVQQRDALQAEVQTLKEQIKQLTDKTQLNNAQQEILADMKAETERYRQEFEKEKELRKQAEDKLDESQNAIDELRAKINELDSRPNPELPTEREMDLWAELQATKDSLRMTEEEMNVCKRERVRFLESLTKISESENKVGIQQKLAAELLSKEEIISKMQVQIRELTKNVRLNEQKVQQYEQYVHDTQAHARAVANCTECPNGISYQDLQQEIMTLQMNLLDAVHRNEELSEVLAQREQQLEQQDKTSRAQARVIKVREELINMLKNKETEQSRELSALQEDLEHRMQIVDEVNKQIAAKAEEIQELFTALETKQQQIHRMEKIVLALEEQQRRAQAQRTKHEEKIAALEHELAAGNRRERRFLFF